MGKLSSSAFSFRTIVFLHSFTVVLAFLISCHHVNGVTLDTNGYYDIVIAINEKTAQNDNENYLDNLKAGIQDLSAAIYETTNNSFSIRSVDIVLPDHWNIDADAIVTTQNYQNADIRISHEYSVPQAINPTFCGHPGHHIELPYSFFDKRDNGLYGPTGKALLTLWARYRWGIFEEHGYPGDPLFPYFWKAWVPNPIEGEPEPEQPWKVTSCSNAEIKGRYVTLPEEKCYPGNDPFEVTTETPVDTTTLEPEDSDLYPPPSNRRFCPDIENQTATSSVMSFIFIQSLLHFCDETTHDKRAPNRQNHFCQFKSAWEVIRESKDWKQLEEGVNKVLHTIFDSMNVVAGAGVFPGQFVQDYHDSYDAVYDWNTPWYNKRELITAFQTSFGSRENTTFRDFGAAVKDIGNRISDMKHPAGAVVVMLKYGSETDEFFKKQWVAYEGEAVAAILQQNIRLFVLEGEDSQADSEPSAPFRLKNIAELSGGMHLKIGNGEENVKNVNEIMAQVEDILTSGRVPASRYRLAYMDSRAFEASDDYKTYIPFSVNYHNVKGLLLYFHFGTPSASITDSPKISEGPEGVTDLPSFNEYPQWGTLLEEDDMDPYKWPSYKSFFANWTTEHPLTDPSEWTCSFESWSPESTVSIIVIAELDNTRQDSQHTDNDIKIEVYTSAEDDGNIADLAVQSVSSLKGVAFSIYAKLEKNGHPINSPDLEVLAHVCHYRDREALFEYDIDPPVDCTAIILKDTGPLRGDLDLIANDGIFSGSYTPREPLPDKVDFHGTHRIAVTAKILNKTDSTRSGPLPVDQENIKCGSGYQGCWSETVTEPFFVHADLKHSIVLTKLDDYHGAATRVLDLSISQTPKQPDSYDIQWTEPAVWQFNSLTYKADEYELQYASSLDDVLAEVFRDKVYRLPVPFRPGDIIKVTVTDLFAGEKRWYRLKSVVGNPKSSKPVWSNILFAYAEPAYFQTTTTTTTTTTPPSTPSTTRLPTSERGPTTLPTKVTAQQSTTRRHRSTPSTTRRSTTVTTTTTRPTTRKFEQAEEKVNYWYKSTEAIVTFSVFGVGMAVVIGGVLSYIKVTNRVV